MNWTALRILMRVLQDKDGPVEKRRKSGEVAAQEPVPTGTFLLASSKRRIVVEKFKGTPMGVYLMRYVDLVS